MKYFCLLFVLLAPFLEATERMPWYPRYLELQPRATWLYQDYQKVDTAKGSQHHSSHDNFLFLSISGAYDRWAVELEISAAATHHRNFSLSDISLTGRYQWKDDIIGDAVSLTTGLTVSHVFEIALHDISCFYHGGIQLEGHVAVGKEFCLCQQFWISRAWGVLGLGIADHGSPWVRFDAAWEHNVWDCHRFRIFADSLWGLGRNNLSLKHHFHGYGPIHHQSIDLGFAYSHHFEAGAIVDLGYSYRVHAHDCPERVNKIFISLLYPFGL